MTDINDITTDTLAALPFNEAYDSLMEYVSKQDIGTAVETIESIIQQLPPESPLLPATYRILARTHLNNNNMDAATHSVATGLSILAQAPKRRDEPFIATLAFLLLDLANIHSALSRHKAAERDIEKSAQLFERLARTNKLRYGPHHINALATATQIYKSRIKQANLLAHYHAATETYLALANNGDNSSAGLALANSIAREGYTLADMGKHREAIQYFTRALKYLTRIQPEFTTEQLDLSVALGLSLLSVKATRDKGIHLLNTMLHKATKLNATDTHTRIVRALADSRTPGIDILNLWHKIFPR